MNTGYSENGYNLNSQEFDDKGFIIGTRSFLKIFVNSIIGITKSTYWMSGDFFGTNMVHLISKFRILKLMHLKFCSLIIAYV